MGETRHAPLSGFEKFGLVSGIIGLVADVIALIAFLTGFLNLGQIQSSLPGNPLFLIVTALLLLYGWFALAWMFARRGLNNIEPAKRSRTLSDAAVKATTGAGVLLVPPAILWLMALSSLLGITGNELGAFWIYGFFFYCFAGVILGLGVSGGLTTLMPLVYEDLA